MNNLRIKRHPSAFTLIELLTVITIIGILASMSFPVVTGVMNRARKVKTLAMIKDLHVGIRGYYTEYGHYPSEQTKDDDKMRTNEGELIAILLASDAQTKMNGRGIKFVELPVGKNGRGGLVGQSADDYQLLDEWGQPLYVIMDTSGDEKVENPDVGNEDPKVSSGASPELPVGVAIYSLGENGAKKGGLTKSVITSWRG